MNFARNQSLKIFLTGLFILTIAMIVVYKYNYSQTIKNELHHTEFIVDEYSKRINQLILEKVNTIKTITVSPVMITALNESNAHYSFLSEQLRSEEIQSQEDIWQTIEDKDDPFVLKYTSNPVSQHLIKQQNLLKGEYGEIFLTNKYGALVASTAKLTTLAHDHKYWWKGAFNDGIGAVFFDDRGYDDSVGGYVLGVVVPIKKGDEIIGILKANLNILGSISKMILTSQNEHLGKLKLIRSSGLIIFEEGVEPLSKRIPSEILEKFQSNDAHSFICDEESDKRMIGISEIGISSGMEGYSFGGSFESLDHKKGNTGESWKLMCYRPISILVKPIHATLTRLLFIGMFLSIFLAIISLIFGKRAAKPIKELIELTNHIATGNFDTKITIKRKDEIGLLAVSFNQMAMNLKDSTTSIYKLNAEINERKNIEALLEQEKKLARQYLDVAGVILLATNNEHKITLINPKGCEVLGYTEEEILGKNWLEEFIPNDNVDEIKRIYDQIESGQIKKVEYYENPIIRKDGSIRTIAWRNSTVYDKSGNIIGVFSSGEDITERKQADKKIRLNEERLKDIIFSSADWIWEIDEKGIYTYSSDKCYELFGLSSEDIIGKTPFDLMSTEEVDRVAKVFSEIVANKLPIKDLENWNIKMSGERICLLTNGVPILDKDGNLKGYRGVDKDITERKHVEENIVNKTKELEKQFEKSEKQRIATTVVLNDLNKTTAELKAEISEHKLAEKKIKQNLKEKNTLLQELYHRTKNNMQIISSMLRMQSRSIENRSLAGGSNIDFMHDSFNDVINKIKAMSLVHQKLYQAEDLSHINLREYIKDLVNLLMISYGVRSESLSLKLDLKDVFVLIDSAIPLGLVLNELISNVFKHAFPNSKNDEIIIRLFQDKDGTINIQLSDNGAGIPADIDLENVNTMGLQTVFNLIIHQLKGEITYKSDKGLKWKIKLKDNLHHERV